MRAFEAEETLTATLLPNVSIASQSSEAFSQPQPFRIFRYWGAMVPAGTLVQQIDSLLFGDGTRNQHASGLDQPLRESSGVVIDRVVRGGADTPSGESIPVSAGSDSSFQELSQCFDVLRAHAALLG
jgi:hypothetical protein